MTNWRRAAALGNQWTRAALVAAPLVTGAIWSCGCNRADPPLPTHDEAAQQPPLSADPGPSGSQTNKVPD